MGFLVQGGMLENSDNCLSVPGDCLHAHCWGSTLPAGSSLVVSTTPGADPVNSPGSKCQDTRSLGTYHSKQNLINSASGPNADTCFYEWFYWHTSIHSFIYHLGCFFLTPAVQGVVRTDGSRNHESILYCPLFKKKDRGWGS